ncbi:MAG: hypothetical protein VKJ06_02010 [Vampirovibrionales bacterium]|nr:hypothetical protein [Vampirovibrionales bacterium]
MFNPVNSISNTLKKNGLKASPDNLGTLALQKAAEADVSYLRKDAHYAVGLPLMILGLLGVIAAPATAPAVITNIFGGAGALGSVTTAVGSLFGLFGASQKVESQQIAKKAGKLLEKVA